MPNNTPEIIVVSRLPIRLGQFLKLAEIVLDGSEATSLITSGEISVNSEMERRRGRKLCAGDIVQTGNTSWQIASASDT